MCVDYGRNDKYVKNINFDAIMNLSTFWKFKLSSHPQCPIRWAKLLFYSRKFRVQSMA